jgi:hypothetical protein
MFGYLKMFSIDFDCIAAQLIHTLPQGGERFVRKKLGLIAWKTGGQFRFVRLSAFNRFIYRLSTDLAPSLKNAPAKILGVADPNSYPRHQAELNFHHTETALIKGAELVRFIEDCFRFPTQPKHIYRWPLFFASGKWQPHMAWTELAQSAQRKLSPEERLSKFTRPPMSHSKQKFNPEPRTTKQEQNNEKVLSDLVQDQKRSYSPAAREQYRKLRKNLRKAIQASGHSEEQVVNAIAERYPSQAGAQRLEDISPRFLRWARDHWGRLDLYLNKRKREENLT